MKFLFIITLTVMTFSALSVVSGEPLIVKVNGCKGYWNCGTNATFNNLMKNQCCQGHWNCGPTESICDTLNGCPNEWNCGPTESVCNMLHGNCICQSDCI